MPPGCALLGGFAIGARVALLWQHNANAKWLGKNLTLRWLGTGAQPRSRSWGVPIPWSRLLYRTKYGWYTSFVHCSLLCNGNHTLHQRSWGGVSKFWGSGLPQWLHPWLGRTSRKWLFCVEYDVTPKAVEMTTEVGCTPKIRGWIVVICEAMVLYQMRSNEF